MTATSIRLLSCLLAVCAFPVMVYRSICLFSGIDLNPLGSWAPLGFLVLIFSPPVLALLSVRTLLRWGYGWAAALEASQQVTQRRRP